MGGVRCLGQSPKKKRFFFLTPSLISQSYKFTQTIIFCILNLYDLNELKGVCFLMLFMFVCGLQRRYDGDPAEHKMASGFDAILLQRPFPNISY